MRVRSEITSEITPEALSESLAPFDLAIMLAVLAVAALGLCQPAWASPEIEALSSLRSHRFTSVAIPVPADGFSFSRDTATWTLESGSIRLQEPVDGVVTGLVFEGRGRFHMTIPDPIELRHVRRVTGQADLQSFDATFTELVVRTSEPSAFEWLGDAAQAGEGSYSENDLAKGRHEHWLIKRFDDVDARVIAGLHLANDAYLRVGMKTEAYDWLTYDFDDLELEEERLEKFQSMNDYTEVWLNLDRPEDRTAGGRPNGVNRWPIDIEHLQVAVDVTDRTTRGRAGFSNTALSRARFLATIRFTVTRDGLGALPLTLSPLSEVESVTDSEGHLLPFIREGIGDLTRSLDDRLFDDSLVVLLPTPYQRGETHEIEVSYTREIFNYVSGRSWYPGLPQSFTDQHTAQLRITAREQSEVRAIGTLDEKIAGDDDTVTWVWTANQPTKMAGFSFADRVVEETIELEGIPKVIAFSPPVASRSKAMVHNVGADIANSLRFFQWLFDSQLEVDHIYATGIPAGHGQAFEGFLHLSEFTFAQESINSSELFRSHEVAHQWWGHLVGWQSYRDQWLSEAFAEYSSMMFVEATTKSGKKLFADVLDAYTDLMLGKRIADFNRFVRPGLGDLDSDHLARLGPIGLGWRASTCQMPQGYTLQNYYKGPLVLHMLRELLRRPGTGDDLFVTVLRDFIKTHRGGAASTKDFQAVIEKHAGGDWSWFFDQWVDSTTIPTYRWNYRVTEEGGKPVLELTVEQSDVPEGFIMSVPVRIELASGKSGTLRVTVQKPKETFRFPMPAKPREVVFNPDHAVLARVSKG